MKTYIKVCLGLLIVVGILAILNSRVFLDDRRPASQAEVDRMISAMDYVIKEKKDKWWQHER